MSKIGTCKLCSQEAELHLSHLYPKFALKWLKNTSPTGFLRSSGDINKRKQDGPKDRWFCRTCEQLFSKDEKLFSEKVFVPYTKAVEELTTFSSGKILGDFVLRFIISLQYRALVCSNSRDKLNPGNKVLIEDYQVIWREFLLRKRGNTGNCESHIIFLTSLEGAGGDIERFGFPPNINKYLARSMDNTIFDSESGKVLGVFSKIGPIGFMTFIKPNKVKGMIGTKINMGRNQLTSSQIYKNQTVVDFIWKNRPLELHERTKVLDPTEVEKINKSYRKNPVRVAQSHGERMNILDQALNSIHDKDKK